MSFYPLAANVVRAWLGCPLGDLGSGPVQE